MGRIVIGIDPGMSGGVARLNIDTSELTVHRMPVLKFEKVNKNAKSGKGTKTVIDKQGLRRLLEPMDETESIIHVIREDVHSMPRDGGVQAFNFGRGVGFIEGLVTGLGLAETPVSPQAWKKKLGVRADKDAARARASELMPACSDDWKLVRDDGLAEAAMILLWWLGERGIQLPGPITPVSTTYSSVKRRTSHG